MDLSPGSTFAGYEIRGEIGRGAMGIVYLAYDPKLDREVALKVVAEHLAQDSAFRARFAQEAKAAARVEHPSVVAIYQTGEENDIPFLAMRLVRGRELSAILAERGSYEIGAAVALLRPIAAGLDAAHAANIVHRDVKPANILVPDDGSAAVLVDFGIGRVMQGTRATQTGSWVGTVDYVAPEQIRGGDVDGRADQYALGCVLYEMIAGEPPFRREDTIQSLFAHANDAPPVVATGDAAADTRVGAAITRALSKDVDSRFASCGDLLDVASGGAEPSSVAQVSHKTGTLIAAAPVAPAASAVGPTGTIVGKASASQPAVPGQSQAKTRSATWIVAGFGAVFVVILIGAGLMFTLTRSGTPEMERTALCVDAADGVSDAITSLEQVRLKQNATANRGMWNAAADANRKVIACWNTAGTQPVGGKETQEALGAAMTAITEHTPKYTPPPIKKRVPLPRNPDSGNWYVPEESGDHYDEINSNAKPCYAYAGLRAIGWSYDTFQAKSTRVPPVGWEYYDTWCEAMRGEREPPRYVIKVTERDPVYKLSATGVTIVKRQVEKLRILGTPDYLMTPKP
jgi:serine/threonine protein kinase